MDVLCFSGCVSLRCGAAPRRLAFGRAKIAIRVRAAKDGSESQVKTATDAVNLGLSLFSKGRVKDALHQFDTALAMNPNFDEAQAAYYNKACCHASREEPAKAAQALQTALRDYNVKFHVILNDPDLAPFRASPEFKALQDEARKGGEDTGSSFRRDLKLISEVQAPFRGVRKFFYVAFTIAAGIATFITVPRLIRALQGGEDAPSVTETAQNLAIDLAGIVAFVSLFIWDSKKEETQMSQITRNETLSRLPVRLGTGRIVEVVQLRGITRPVILAGTKESIKGALEKAERYRKDLLQRGVLLIPVEWRKKDETPKKKGFGRSVKAPAAGSGSDDFQKRAQDAALKAVLESEKRFVAEVVSQAEWERWIFEQQESEGVTGGEEVFIVLRLDGRIRKSGRGMPEWQELVKELPVLDSMMSKLER
ncbi:hypothetical protein SELMODRAFT_162731 [Selaginella moellendorffii]|uniref:Uncharacterized protein n=2 Tax=Selaginella moellendorffii TaxID=88036 RepID=D8TBN8_SELML|nr:protein LOW PSII ACCUMULATION 1, chloroplastic isoform X1 [Selaginella moellendorffii]EFJ05959.1 hypothetical protein SELMODRAFT_162731 [Selaginella moellendorffii]|eukprot:XP_002993013.1 protein LOW PSII ACCUMULATION 1, chloroplastic isoform X1 [Selaginella moellendorffii]